MANNKIPMDGKYHWNERYYQWERADRVQEYMGCTITTITTHDDSHTWSHREYRITFPNGEECDFRINKRAGGNIKDLKEWLDWKEREGTLC